MGQNGARSSTLKARGEIAGRQCCHRIAITYYNIPPTGQAIYCSIHKAAHTQHPSINCREIMTTAGCNIMTPARRSCCTIAGMLFLFLSVVLSPHTAHAQDMCSCSPTVFTFVLNLDGSCEVNDIDGNDGVDDSFCFVEDGVALPSGGEPEPEPDLNAKSADDEPTTTTEATEAAATEADTTTTEEPTIDEGMSMPETTTPAAPSMCTFCPDGLDDPEKVLPTDDDATCQSAKDYAESITADDSMCRQVQRAEPLCCFEEDVRRLAFRDRNHRRRRLQEKVVEIVSVQFLEFDTSGDLTVINQDDTYSDVTLGDGDRLKFNSASSFLDTSLPLDEQMSSPALVPGGASIILYGKTESGEIVRNRFFWMYDMNCGRTNDPVQVGDEIGWVRVEETANAWPAFCPALPEGSPTISPRTNEPTLTPSKSPILPPGSGDPTPSPTIRTSIITGHPAPWGPAFGSKSSKQAKTLKPGKSGKSSKSGKSGKSGKGSKGMDGKTWKSPASGDHEYYLGRVVTVDVSSAASDDSSSRLYGFGLSLVAGLLLLVRQ